MHFSRRLALAFFAALLCASGALALDNGQARTPPMGWNSWNKFQCNVSEKLIKEMADAMVSSGMKDAGYQYIVIDDCWQVSRDAQGNIVPDPERFPSGMKALADYVHSKGLKFGLYSDAGEYTCQRRPGSKGYETQDAKQYAAWGVDYLKYDWCNTRGQSAPESYATMSKALQATGRPVVFSICEWGASKPWTWAKDVGNLWRTTGDITDRWSSTGRQLGPPPGGAGGPNGPNGMSGADGMAPGAPAGGPPPGGPPSGDGPPPVAMGLGFLQILDQQADLADTAGPGHWNDPDMLEVGNGGMSNEEYRAHFSLWAMLAAPLIAGNDLRNMTPEIEEILTNKEVIAISQDKLGKQGRRVNREGDLDVWSKELADGSHAVALLNRGTEAANISIDWKALNMPSKQAMRVRDLWQHRNLGKHKVQFSTQVAGHSVVMVRIG